ncbi:MAG: hypothetical protein HZB59_02470 [Ignavibacteriales bacterium]|nr:hypothetical protein [Ignavibacteriales bacterium]
MLYNRCKIFFLIISILLGYFCATAQLGSYGVSNELKFRLSKFKDTTIVLTHPFIIPTSLTVRADSIDLKDSIDYIYDQSLNTITIKKVFKDDINRDNNNRAIAIKYRQAPFLIKKNYKHRIPQSLSDSMKTISERISKPRTSFSVDDLFGSNLQASGSIVRGFTLGTNRDLSLNSGFRMQMSGKLADDVEVIGSLTDENSPLQPEGTTQTLQEIDKVLIEIRSENMSATLGDININVAGNEFGNLNRKLSGAKGSINYSVGKVGGDFHIAGAVTRGKFTTNEFQGFDGVQGPYRLTGERNNRNIIVIAGSERVYLNGEKMLRGENADYTIDYATAEITFTIKRLIMRGSRIITDYEYTDRQYNRSLYGGKTGIRLMDDKLKMNFMFFQENDNENAPIDISLSESDKSILRDAGNDPQKAYRSGIEEVGIGKGQYMAIDTVVKTVANTDSILRIYRFNPVDTVHSIYNLSFAYTGTGSYKKISIGRYEFAGIGRGNYEPIKYLPVPESRSLFDFDINLKPVKDFEITGEYGVSNYSANKFAPEAKVIDNALSLKAIYSRENLNVAGINFGSLDFGIKERFVGKSFSPLDRVNEVEYNRNWNISDHLKEDENLIEGNLTYKPKQFLTFGTNAGKVTRGDGFNTLRYSISGEISDELFPFVRYRMENIKTQNNLFDSKSKWSKQYLDSRYKYGIIEPRIQLSYEDLKTRRISNDSLISGSYLWTDIGGGVGIKPSDKLLLESNVKMQRDDSLNHGKITHVSDRFIQEYNARWVPDETFSTNVEVAAQQRKFTDDYIRRGNVDNSNILFRWQTNTSFINRAFETELYYEATRGMTAKLERLFQHVPKGTGSYIYLGDLNNNLIIDQEDFQLSRFDGEYVAVVVPGDQLIPVAEVKAASRFRLEPERLFKSNSMLQEVISAVSTETYLRVEEKSSKSNVEDIYYLKLNRFQDESTTLAGSNLVVQDIHLLKDNQIFSSTYRYTQSKSMTQYASFGEKRYRREHFGRIRWQLIEEISNQTELSQKSDIRSGYNGGLRSWSISSNSFLTDWSYRPWQELEVGFKFGFGEAINCDTIAADMNDQSLRCQYTISADGQLRIEFTREEVTVNKTIIEPLFELTEGKLRGQSWLWRFLFEYRLVKNLQMEINYFGRSEGRNAAMHNVKAVLRAFF